MNAKMFIYLYGSIINKSIATYFNVTRIRMPKIKITKPEEGILKTNQLGGYDSRIHIIYINEVMWNISSDYDRYGLFVHELIHGYQHTYGLCEMNYALPYAQRPQEIHCHIHTSKVLDQIGRAHV